MLISLFYTNFSMKYILRESKESTIKSLKNLTNEQKEELIKFFNGKGQSLWNKIDWNKKSTLIWDDFTPLFSYKSNTVKKKEGILDEGEDYDIIENNDSYTMYVVKTYKASVTLASNKYGLEVWTDLPEWYNDEDAKHDYEEKVDNTGHILFSGAKWCISMRHTSKYWNDYTTGSKYPNMFLFVLFKTPFNYGTSRYINKLAVQYKDLGTEFTLGQMFDEEDDSINIEIKPLKEIIQKNEKLIKESFSKIPYHKDVIKKIPKIEGYEDEVISAYIEIFDEIPTRRDLDNSYSGRYSSLEEFALDYITGYGDYSIGEAISVLGYEDYFDWSTVADNIRENYNIDENNFLNIEDYDDLYDKWEDEELCKEVYGEILEDLDDDIILQYLNLKQLMRWEEGWYSSNNFYFTD